MALLAGTNCGFVTEAPVADPDGGIPWVLDNTSQAVKDTSPVGATKITEIGWWCDNATPDVNFKVGLYAHDVSLDKPAARLYVDATNAKGAGAGWKTVAVDWDIDPETIYWIAVQLDNTSTTNTDGAGVSGASRYSAVFAESTLLNPWPSSSQGGNLLAFYALWTGTSYVELSGAIAGVSSLMGAMDVATFIALAGTIPAVASLAGNLGSVLVHVVNNVNYTRLAAVGNDQFWYEDI